MAVAFSSRAEAALRGRGGRMTRNRRALLRLIESAPRPLAPRELHRELRRRRTPMDLVSVYRNVSALLELGLLHRVLGSAAVRPCAGREPRCHHAVVCMACGSAREFHSRRLERALGEVRRATGFSIQEHLLELRGLCAACRGVP
jgi:Fur family ferric uptake transcriptional regulator